MFFSRAQAMAFCQLSVEGWHGSVGSGHGD